VLPLAHSRTECRFRTGMSPELLQAIGEANYVAPTPIQAAAIPAFYAPRCAGCARRGPQDGRVCVADVATDCWVERGRPSAERGNPAGAKAREPQRGRAIGKSPALLVPTRELAIQVGDRFASSVATCRSRSSSHCFWRRIINPQMMAYAVARISWWPLSDTRSDAHNAVRLSAVSTLVLTRRSSA